MKKKYTVGQIKEIVRIAVLTFVSGEDNSWKCKHNLNVLLQSIDDTIALEKVGQKIKESMKSIKCKKCGEEIDDGIAIYPCKCMKTKEEKER